MDLRAHLQRTLGSAYAIDRELGGGGMGRVFAATELALGRKVAIKVLPPDLTGSVSSERFRREILVVAQLHHAHVVPVLLAGEADGIPYFTMPLVDGESLRERLGRDGPLAIGDAVGILRDIADALAYAHARGIVHRDVKPENILLSHGHAFVTDFGVAKALAAAERGAHPERDNADPSTAGLTSRGIALGTPAYMAPEQVAADPATDARADLYALGVVAFEMLTGRPPFGGQPREVLAAHLASHPRPVTADRPEVPAALASLVMRCLEKDPAARPQSAADVLRALTDMTGPAFDARMHDGAPGTLRRGVVVYAIAAAAVVALGKLATLMLDVPDWVFSAAAMLALLGIPLVVMTGLATRVPPRVPPAGGSATKPRRLWLTWRRAAWVGAGAIVGLAGVVGAYVVLRALGIGPVGSLLAAGAVRVRERVLVADFEAPASDSLMGIVVAEALRTDLSQSGIVTLVQPSSVRSTLERMQRTGGAPLTHPVAREVAVREGVELLIDGDVRQLGSGYVLAARLVSAEPDTVIAAFRETATDAKGVIPAVDRLSKRLRAKVGESLRALRAAPRLERVTTSSLDALRKYTQALRILQEQGDYARTEALLESAIALDTGFAMAYRKLGVVLRQSANLAGSTQRGSAAMEKAFAHRDRLPDLERQLTIGAYYSDEAHFDPAKALQAYEDALAVDSTNVVVLTNLGKQYIDRGDWKRGIAYWERALAIDSMETTTQVNLAQAYLALGDTTRGLRTLGQAARRHPENSEIQAVHFGLMFILGNRDSATALARAAAASPATDYVGRLRAYRALSLFALTRGRLREGDQFAQKSVRPESTAPVSHKAALDLELFRAEVDVNYHGRGAAPRAVARAERALAQHPWSSIPPLERPYAMAVSVYAAAGRTDKARAVLSQARQSLAPTVLESRSGDVQVMLGQIALAEGHGGEAVAALRRAAGICGPCAWPLARAFEMSGSPDSAVATYEKYLASPTFDRLFSDAAYLAPTYTALARLYAERGRARDAATMLKKFVDLWSDADPELQPQVAEARARLARLR